MPKGPDAYNWPSLKWAMSAIPTITTACDQADLRSACLNAGAIGYLNKPPDPQQLTQMIKTISQMRPADKVASSGLLPKGQTQAVGDSRYSPLLVGKITRKMVP